MNGTEFTLHRKKLLTGLLIAVALLVLSGSYYVFFREITTSRYNKIMFYYIARNAVRNASNFDEKIVALKDLVHENIHPVGQVASYDYAIQHLLFGNGWCDQQSRVFMWLARGIEITSRLLFLKLESGVSPHSVAEVLTPDKRWIIVDSLYNLHLVTRDGRLATQNDIKNDLSIVTNNKRVKLRSRYNNRWADPDFLSIYYNPPRYVITKKGINFDFLKLVPISLLRPIVNIIQNKYFRQIKFEIKDMYEFKMLRARGYHLLGYYEKASKLYNEIMEHSTNLLFIHKTEFYYAVLLKDQKKYTETYRYITELINKYENNPYEAYLFGLRSQILKKMGRSKEAERDLLEIKYSLPAW